MILFRPQPPLTAEQKKANEEIYRDLYIASPLKGVRRDAVSTAGWYAALSLLRSYLLPALVQKRVKALLGMHRIFRNLSFRLSREYRGFFYPKKSTFLPNKIHRRPEQAQQYHALFHILPLNADHLFALAVRASPKNGESSMPGAILTRSLTLYNYRTTILRAFLASFLKPVVQTLGLAPLKGVVAHIRSIRFLSQVNAKVVLETLLRKIRAYFLPNQVIPRFLGLIIKDIKRLASEEEQENPIGEQLRGLSVVCAGRFTKQQLASFVRYKVGANSLSSLKSPVDYAQGTVALKYGAVGLKLSLKTPVSYFYTETGFNYNLRPIRVGKIFQKPKLGDGFRRKFRFALNLDEKEQYISTRRKETEKDAFRLSQTDAKDALSTRKRVRGGAGNGIRSYKGERDRSRP